jgi:glyoxylase-like metal-dependent hydrolase (beta-lactamase superfamily II)
LTEAGAGGGLSAFVVPVTPFQQNCTLLLDAASGAGAVVDPGGEVERILAAAARHGALIRQVLLTHAHCDHAGAAAELAERLGVPIVGPHPDDRFWIESLPEQAQAFGLEPARSFEPTRWLAGGERVQVGAAELEVRHCPGHTPGHVVFVHLASRLALVGDVLFQGSIGRTDFPRGDYATLIRSIRTQLLTLPDDLRFVPGHGPTSTIGAERRSNPFLVHPERYGELA